jgi:hypothetical protein
MPLTGSDCQCSVCNRIFKGERAFDAHRKGKIGVDRRCVNPETVGLHLNARNRWAFPAPTYSISEAIGRGEGLSTPETPEARKSASL